MGGGEKRRGGGKEWVWKDPRCRRYPVRDLRKEGKKFREEVRLAQSAKRFLLFSFAGSKTVDRTRQIFFFFSENSSPPAPPPPCLYGFPKPGHRRRKKVEGKGRKVGFYAAFFPPPPTDRDSYGCSSLLLPFLFFRRRRSFGPRGEKEGRKEEGRLLQRGGFPLSCSLFSHSPSADRLSPRV